MCVFCPVNFNTKLYISRELHYEKRDIEFYEDYLPLYIHIQPLHLTEITSYVICRLQFKFIPTLFQVIPRCSSIAITQT